MRVAVLDGGRHRRWTGYGSLSRSTILGLLEAGAEVVLPRLSTPWDLPEDEQRVFAALQTDKAASTADIALTVATPSAATVTDIPSVIYTQNALGDLPYDWQGLLQGHRAIIVPGEFDREVFARYYSDVRVVPQIVEAHRFRNNPRYRDELGPEPTFTFVGSWGFRKATDVLLDVVGHAFKDTPSRLRLFLGVSKQLNVSDVVRRARRLPDCVELDVQAKVYPPPWMNRFYNQSDFIVTMSRGEGWCMPLHEALVAGVPVIAPASTAMGEALPSQGVIRVTTRPKLVSDVPDAAFRERYGTDTNVVYEPDFDAAVAAFRDAAANLEQHRAAALSGMAAHRALNAPAVFGNALLGVLADVLNA